MRMDPTHDQATRQENKAPVWKNQLAFDWHTGDQTNPEQACKNKLKAFDSTVVQKMRNVKQAQLKSRMLSYPHLLFTFSSKGSSFIV